MLPSSPCRQRRRDAWAVAGALLALLLWDAGGLDLPAVRLYGSAQGFALRDGWLARTLLHDGGRWLALAGVLLLAVNAFRPLWHGPTARERVWWLGATLGCLLLPSLLKHASRTSCPWSLAEFGGVADHVSHWRLGVGDHGPGHCFPSGHAVAAAAFVPGWFVLRRHRARAAALWLAAVLLLTLAYGWAQLARGAHYPSHTVWSAWLCFTTSWLAWPLACSARGAAVGQPGPVRTARAGRRADAGPDIRLDDACTLASSVPDRRLVRPAVAPADGLR